MAIAWIGVLVWLNFTFIEKELVFKVVAGEAILVDLLFGVPLVLMLAVVVYATIYWFLKLVVVYLFPQTIMPISDYDNQSELLEDPELEQILQEKYGQQYWHEDGEHVPQSDDDKVGDNRTDTNKKSDDSSHEVK